MRIPHLVITRGQLLRVIQLAARFDSTKEPVSNGFVRVSNRDLSASLDQSLPINKTRNELCAYIDDLDQKAKEDLLAIVWLGAGNGDWELLRADAENYDPEGLAKYLSSKPLTSYLAKGLATLMLPLADKDGDPALYYTR